MVQIVTKKKKPVNQYYQHRPQKKSIFEDMLGDLADPLGQTSHRLRALGDCEQLIMTQEKVSSRAQLSQFDIVFEKLSFLIGRLSS